MESADALEPPEKRNGLTKLENKIIVPKGEGRGTNQQVGLTNPHHHIQNRGQPGPAEEEGGRTQFMK